MDARSPIDVHYLIWRDQTMAVAHHVAEQTNHLFRGQLELIHSHPRLQRYWDWMHRELSGNVGNRDESIPMCAFIFEKVAEHKHVPVSLVSWFRRLGRRNHDTRD